jgi:pimeloyl-ACP methyl ester carboxylesterase
MLLPAFTTLGAGPVILMLHGIGGGHRAFAPQVETFASLGYRAVAWDMPGYGHSAPIDPYTFKGLAQSCITLIESLLGSSDERRRAAPSREPLQGAGRRDAVPLQPVQACAGRPGAAGFSPLGGQRSTQSGERGGVILLGHSMGAMVAQEVVARRPELVNRLILCGTSPSFGKPDGDWQRDFIAQRTAPLDAGQTMAQLAEVLVPQMIGPGSLPEGVALATHCMAGVNPPTYRKALEAIVTFDRRAALALIQVPTLLVAGEFDKNAPPAVMQKMAERITGSRYAELPGIGHLMNLEAPDEFDALVLGFLADTAAARRTLH